MATEVDEGDLFEGGGPAPEPGQPVPVPRDLNDDGPGDEVDEDEDEEVEVDPDEDEPVGVDLAALATEKLGPDQMIPTARVLMLFGWTKVETIPDAFVLGKAFECLPEQDRVMVCLLAGVACEPHTDAGAARALRTRANLVSARRKSVVENLKTLMGVVEKLMGSSSKDGIRELQTFKMARVLVDWLTYARRVAPRNSEEESHMRCADAAVEDARDHGYLPKA